MERNKNKERAYKYYLKRCAEEGFEPDLWDFEAEIDSSLTYTEMTEHIETELFDKMPSQADIKAEEFRAEKEEIKRLAEKERKEEIKDFKENWEILSNARSIYILGGVRTGKSSLAFGIAKKLQEFKTVYYFNFPQKHLLKEEGFYHLENLNDLSQITDAVVVLDEISLLLRKYEKKNNDELQKILTLAGQNNLTIIFISQISQMVNKALESLIDCFVVMDFDYQNLKNGSRAKNMIKEYCTFQPEHFKLDRGQFLYYSRKFPVFEPLASFPKHERFTDEWSLAYKNKESSFKDRIKNRIERIKW